MVVEVTSDSPAEAAGLQVGDVVLSVDGEAVVSVGDLVAVLRSREIGDQAELEVERHGSTATVMAKLGTRPF